MTEHRDDDAGRVLPFDPARIRRARLAPAEWAAFETLRSALIAALSRRDDEILAAADRADESG